MRLGKYSVIKRMKSSFFHMTSAATLLLLCSSASAQNSEAIAKAPAFSAEELLAPPTDGWITNGGSLFNQRFSPLNQITIENVGDLKGAWRVHLGSGLEAKYSGEAQPLIHEGTIYIVTAPMMSRRCPSRQARSCGSTRPIWISRLIPYAAAGPVEVWEWARERSMSVS